MPGGFILLIYFNFVCQVTVCAYIRYIYVWHLRGHIIIGTSRVQGCGWCPLLLWAFLLLNQGLSLNLELMLYNHIASSKVSLFSCLIMFQACERWPKVVCMYWDPNLGLGTYTSNLCHWSFSYAMTTSF